MYAARGGHLPVVKVLLTQGANVLHKAEVSHTQQWYIYIYIYICFSYTTVKCDA